LAVAVERAEGRRDTGFLAFAGARRRAGFATELPADLPVVDRRDSGLQAFVGERRGAGFATFVVERAVDRRDAGLRAFVTERRRAGFTARAARPVLGR
jgi:hypothetical protein